MAYKLIVTGARNFHNYNIVKQEVDRLSLQIEDLVEIVSGGTNGTDKIGRRYAFRHMIDNHIIKADWKNDGDHADVIRDKKMVEYADGAVVFWNDTSEGTQQLINEAKKAGIKVWLKYVG